MAALEIFLFACLAFGAAAFLLLWLAYILNTCCCCAKSSSGDSESFGDIEASIPLHQVVIHNNNNNDPPAPPVVITQAPVASSSRSPPPSISRLTSIASAPVINELDLNSSYPNLPHGGRRRNTSVYSVDEQIVPEELRAIQAAVLRSGKKFKPEESSLLIGVHSNPTVFSGYCVNMQEKWCEFYRIQTEHLPWQQRRPSSSSPEEPSDEVEFEMKNFLFALMLWYERIKEAKKFQIYTGSRASVQDNSRLWRRAAKLLDHWATCEQIVVQNDNRFHVNLKKDTMSFAEKIMPAEDLSAENFEHFQEFVEKFYDIPRDNFRGTHFPKEDPVPEESSYQQEYLVSEQYQEYIQKVYNARINWIEPCDKCMYMDDEVAASAADISILDD